MLVTIYNVESEGRANICYNSYMPAICMSNLDNALNFVTSIWCEGCGDCCQIVDPETGEILAEVKDGFEKEFEEDFDEEEFEEFYEDTFDETGYNPYLGCYDFDL